MRRTWKPISWISWIASNRVVTKHHRSAGLISQKRMARVGRSVFLPSKTRWRRGQSSWCWSRCMSRTSFPARSDSGPVVRLIRHCRIYVNAACMRQRLRWVLDIDIEKYFDSIPHSLLRDFLDQRVTDGVIRRMIDKWLKAGVLEDGLLQHATEGSPQGGVISPCLSNIFLHHVLDEWFECEVRPRLKGRCTLVRFADDGAPRRREEEVKTC